MARTGTVLIRVLRWWSGTGLFRFDTYSEVEGQERGEGARATVTGDSEHKSERERELGDIGEGEV